MNCLHFDGRSFISSNKSDALKSCLPGQFVVESLAKNANHTINLWSGQVVMCHSYELRHGNDATLLNLLIDILLLYFRVNTAVEGFDNS